MHSGNNFNMVIPTKSFFHAQVEIIIFMSTKFLDKLIKYR